MAADVLVDGAMVHAGAATDAAQGLLHLGAEHRGTAGIHQNHMGLLGAVGIVLAFGAG